MTPADPVSITFRSGFMATYIQIDWVLEIGPARVLGAQAGIGVASVILNVLLQLFGKRLRKWQGRMVFRKAMKAS